MWKHIIERVSDEYPKFNKYLLDTFRKEKCSQIIDALDNIFIEAESTFNGEVEYLGWEMCTPEEFLDQTKAYKKSKLQIMRTTSVLVKFSFAFEGNTFDARVGVPFLYNNAVICNGNYSYPIFALIERGCLNVIKNKVTISLMKNVLSFWRDPKVIHKVTTRSSKTMSSIMVTTKIHNASKNNKCPAMLYLMAKYGWEGLKMLGDYDIEVVKTKDIIKELPDKEYIDILATEVTIVFDKKLLRGIHANRTIVTLHYIMTRRVKYIQEDIYTAGYYKLVLGTILFGRSPNLAKQLNRVVEHLTACDLMLDSPSRQQLRAVNIKVDDLYQLIQSIILKIDTTITKYDSCDLSKKKVASLELLLAQYTETVFGRILKMTSKSQKGLRKSTIGTMIKIISRTPSKFIYGNKMFLSSTGHANDNYLFSIGQKRVRSENNLETSSGYGQKKKKGVKRKTSPPMEVLLAHSSQLWVESINMLPSSNPVLSGSINTFLKIDTDGNIVKTPFDTMADDCFD